MGGGLSKLVPHKRKKSYLKKRSNTTGTLQDAVSHPPLPSKTAAKHARHASSPAIASSSASPSPFTSPLSSLSPSSPPLTTTPPALTAHKDKDKEYKGIIHGAPTMLARQDSNSGIFPPPPSSPSSPPHILSSPELAAQDKENTITNTNSNTVSSSEASESRENSFVGSETFTEGYPDSVIRINSKKLTPTVSPKYSSPKYTKASFKRSPSFVRSPGYVKRTSALQPPAPSSPSSPSAASSSSSSSSITTKNNKNSTESKERWITRSNRPRGRSISDSLFHLNPDGSKDLHINDMQRTIELETSNKKKFQELNAILQEKNVVIDLSELEFVQVIGRGAFSEVWEGYWNGLHVAIKKLKLMVDEVRFGERFLREVENLRKGNHPNVVLFFGVCLKPPCIVTEFMGGGTLYNLLHGNGPVPIKGNALSFPLVMKMATDLAVALSHLHSISILHRDLTPLNILLDEMGNVKISDFGLSREKAQDGPMTMTLGGICNPRWRPPEITKNQGQYSEKIDVYCFGLVVWEMLTADIPFAELDGSQAAAQVAYANLRPVVPNSCHPQLKELIERCWQNNPDDRPDFATITLLLRDITWKNPMGLISGSSPHISIKNTSPNTLMHHPDYDTTNNYELKPYQHQHTLDENTNTDNLSFNDTITNLTNNNSTHVNITNNITINNFVVNTYTSGGGASGDHTT